MEKFATAAEKGDGYDIADYLISHQMTINETNAIARTNIKPI